MCEVFESSTKYARYGLKKKYEKDISKVFFVGVTQPPRKLNLRAIFNLEGLFNEYIGVSHVGFDNPRVLLMTTVSQKIIPPPLEII